MALSRSGLLFQARRQKGLCPSCGDMPFEGVYCSRCLLRSRLYLLKKSGLPEIEIAKAREAWAKFIGICDACWRRDSCGRWCFDHDHTTLTFRGIIGENCNRALGMAGDSPEVLRNLAKYLT
jgi:recombination endonuclease VII